ncbi:hypothetical protein trd_1919 [Thermomicrobium roseum DSM 5159]|uniref:Uncharacterized protein n=1 Tax=Thermomicrobium roseum (strain ATCC 27502 / DSM 5159 / P-2) TaxID=309801 RepID=B9L219_THERP|nr:hypothetical protein trd_1919 [Thermomicrobium roseum DSM 5159]
MRTGRGAPASALRSRHGSSIVPLDTREGDFGPASFSRGPGAGGWAVTPGQRSTPACLRRASRAYGGSSRRCAAARCPAWGAWRSLAEQHGAGRSAAGGAHRGERLQWRGRSGTNHR